MAMLGLLLFACVFIALGIGDDTTKEYCVVSDYDVAANCPEDCDDCGSLMYYANHSREYFNQSDTTFRFLGGIHLLENSTLINMGNAANLILSGETHNSSNFSQPRVVCSESDPGGFSFYNITNLTIEYLSFSQCSGKSLSFHASVALEIQLVHNLMMSGVAIQDTAGFGLMVDSLFGSSHIANTIINSSHNTHDILYGGNLAFYCSDSHSYHFNGSKHYLHVTDSQFLNGINYKSASGVYIQIICRQRIYITFDRVTIKGNRADYGGNFGLRYIGTSNEWTASIHIINSEISNGNGSTGGGLYMTAVTGDTSDSSSLRNHRHNNDDDCDDDGGHGVLLSVRNTTFKNNSAPYAGAAVYLRLHQNYHAAVGTIVFDNCTFRENKLHVSANNTLSHGGAGVHIITYALPEHKQHITVFFEIEFTRCEFFENGVQATPGYSAPRTGVFYAQYVRSVNISRCRFYNNTCSGVVAIHSNLLLRDWNVIYNNTGIRGGGMFFCAGSTMHLYNGTTLYITRNTASQYGGGIYVEDDCSQTTPFCFFQVDNITADNATLHQTRVFLTNNNAKSAGTTLYGGLVDHCILFDKVGQKYSDGISEKIFNATFHMESWNKNVSNISSDPTDVCFCINKTINTGDCLHSTSVYVLPGSSFQVSAILIGQRHGLVSGIVDAQCTDKNCDIPTEHRHQLIHKNQCTNLTYMVLSAENTNVSLELVAEDFYLEYPAYRFQPSLIRVHILKCPLGFEARSNKCFCLVKDVECNIDSESIIRQSPKWIGYMPKHMMNATNIITHPFCPLGYCFDHNVSISTTNKSFDQDAQCVHERSGLLCGQCKTNYSLGFGTSVCLRCKHKPLPGLRVVGLIAVCGVAGILLVVLLTLLNLTVSEGTLNGLIFYANIVQVNSHIFFPLESHARPLTAFIAWLNLDFGITTCFYDGMDAYAKTWLQFLFPLYIWLISGAIVYFSWKSNRVARLAGRNAVKVLATLFLLSFGKLLRNIIAAVSYTDVVSHDRNIHKSVWLPDASIHYLHTKHITLYVTAVLAGVLTILYTLTLTFIQCLRKAPNSRMFVWVRKLKPLLDAYTGPYKNRYHFWTGLLLLARIFLFLCFALNVSHGPTLNLGLIVIVCVLLLVASQPGIYRNLLLGLLDSSLYLNLILFSMIRISLLADFYGHFEYSTYSLFCTATAYLFGGWALVTFLGIAAYHAYRWLFGAPDCGQVRVWCREKLRPHGVAAIQPVIIPRDDSEELESEESGEENVLIEYSSMNFSQLREPLIGSIQ